MHTDRDLCTYLSSNFAGILSFNRSGLLQTFVSRAIIFISSYDCMRYAYNKSVAATALDVKSFLSTKFNTVTQLFGIRTSDVDRNDIKIHKYLVKFAPQVSI